MTPKAKSDYVCIKENKLSDHEAKIAELETRADYKEEKINQIIEDNRRMEDKIDKMTEAIYDLQVQSHKDDYDIDKRVTAIEAEQKTIYRIIGLVTVGLALLDVYLKVFV